MAGDSIEKLKREFLEHLEIEKGAALRTIENYDSYLTRFFASSGAKSPGDITDSSIREFRLWLNRQPGIRKAGHTATLSKKTQNYYMIALRAFLKYLTKREIKCLPADRIELAKTSERHLDLITPAELSRLLEAPKGDDLKTLRDKAMLELFFSTGMRVSELCSLPRDINLLSEEISILGKGGKVRVVFISARAKAALQKYLSVRKDMEEGLFVRVGRNTRTFSGSQDKKQKNPKKYTGKEYGSLDRHSVEAIIRQYATMAGISKKVTPHVIRHCFATDLLNNGADLRSVQAILGHANIATTQIYTHVTDKHLRDIHTKFHNKK